MPLDTKKSEQGIHFRLCRDQYDYDCAWPSYYKDYETPKRSEPRGSMTPAGGEPQG